ncbi:hypothetical protein ABFV54_28065, partial [Pseudomonas syringae]|uniref:hypothetical protein n=1 Tax=Pseudomonas syringae TaxID=317 RepID=UPI0034D53C6C
MSNIVEKSQLVVGVDAGHNEIKVFTIDPVTKQEIKFSIPSIGKQGEGDFLGEIDEIHKKLIVVNNEVYSVDPNIPS